jgi:hypothetical protein
MRDYVTIGMLCTVLAAVPQFVLAGENSDGSSATKAEETTTSRLDSRNLPHPDWVQVSGEVEGKQMLIREGEPDRLIVMLKAIEGGIVRADLGAASGLEHVELQDHDYIHVRGPMSTRGTNQMLVAGEIIAETLAVL